MGRRDDDDDDIQDTSVREAKHQTSGRLSLDVPKGLQFWKPKKSGSHEIDIIPYRVTEEVQKFDDAIRYAAPGKRYHERTYFVHRKIGVNEDTVVCLAKTFGKPCPICQDRARYRESPNKEDQKLAKDLAPSERQLFLIYDLDDKSKGVQLWDVSNWNFGKQLDQYVSSARKSEREAYQKFSSLRSGFELRITGEERPMPSGTNTIYSVNQFYKRDNPIPEEIAEHGYDLDAIVRYMTYEYVNNLYRGGEPEEDEESGPPSRSDRPRDTEGTRATTRRPVDDEEPPTSRRGNKADTDPPEAPTRRERPREEEPPTGRRESVRDTETTPPPSRRESKPEPKPTPKPAPEKTEEFGSKDIVSFEGKDGPVEGEIESVDMERKIARLKVPGRDRLVTMDFEDLTLVKRFDVFDAKPEPKSSTNGKHVRDDRGEWDDDKPPAKKQTAPPADDDDPPPRRR